MNATIVSIRPERSADAPGVDAVLRRAFGGPEEAGLVSRLRAEGRLRHAHVAASDGRIVGSIAFSPVEVDGATGCLALAPLAVDPDWQRRGIGARLTRAGLAACRAHGVRAVFVLGHPGYYPRFDFAPASPRGFWFRAPGDEPAFMLQELVPGALEGATGEVRYAAAFDGV